MKLRQFEDLTPQEQGMVILIDFYRDNVKVYGLDTLTRIFNELNDSTTLGEFDWKTHDEKRAKAKEGL